MNNPGGSRNSNPVSLYRLPILPGLSFLATLPAAQDMPGRTRAPSSEIPRGRDGQLVAPLVFWMSGVASHDRELHQVPGEQFVQLSPDLFVLKRLKPLPFAAAPAVSFPGREPFQAPLRDVLAVGHDLDARAFFKRLETGDHGLKLHAVIRRPRF